MHQRWLNFGYWTLLSAALWLLLTGGTGWLFGLVLAPGAAALAVWLEARPPRLRLRHLPAFVVFFLWELLAGGWDVARRALHPRLPLNPAWVQYPLQQHNPQVTLLLSALVGLLPGTFASRVAGDHLVVHTLDRNLNWQGTVARLERHLLALLGGEPQ